MLFLSFAFLFFAVHHQPLLDGVLDYLPHPAEVNNTALVVGEEAKKVSLDPKREDITKPFLGLAFKLEVCLTNVHDLVPTIRL